VAWTPDDGLPVTLSWSDSLSSDAVLPATLGFSSAPVSQAELPVTVVWGLIYPRIAADLSGEGILLVNFTSSALSGFSSSGVLVAGLASGLKELLSGSGLLSAGFKTSSDGVLSGTGVLSAVQAARLVESLSAAGALSAVLSPVQNLAAALSGSGSLSAVQSAALKETLTGLGVLSSVLNPIQNLAATLSGTGLLSAVQSAKLAAALTGVGTLSAVQQGRLAAALSGSGTLTSALTTRQTIAQALSGTGSLVAQPQFPTTAAVLTTISTAGVNTYTIPYWCNKLDVVVLGGGGGGNAGGGLFSNGGGGGAGGYGSKTLVRGTDIGWAKTSLSVYVGAGGAGGVGGYGSSGYGSALAVEFGAAGPGVTVASGTGTISGSWTHTPASSDNYVLVAVSVSNVGAASATRSVTYGGVAMTSLNVIDAGGASGNGWLEMFGLGIAAGAGAKTVVATVTGSVTFTNLKADSVSYGNVGTVTALPNGYDVPASGGTNAAPFASSFAAGFGGMVVGAIFAKTSTLSSYTAGVTSRYANATAPSFYMTDDNSSGFGYQTGGTLAASSPWAAIAVSLASTTAGSAGIGGASSPNQGVTEQGSSPGNLTFNSQTYTGGAAAGTNNNGSTINGNAPGGGGAGTNGVFIGSGANAGAGATGRVWIRAYQ